MEFSLCVLSLCVLSLCVLPVWESDFSGSKNTQTSGRFKVQLTRGMSVQVNGSCVYMWPCDVLVNIQGEPPPPLSRPPLPLPLPTYDGWDWLQLVLAPATLKRIRQ